MIGVRSFPLRFAEFDLEFRVDSNASVDNSQSLRQPGSPDYAFAAGEVWLILPESSSILIDKFCAGNMLEMLREIDKRLADIGNTAGVETYIEAGKWCEWIANYWTRKECDSVTRNDEEIYDTLRSALLTEGDSGRLAIYGMQDVRVVEACAIDSGVAISSVLSSAAVIEIRAAISALVWEISDFVRFGLKQ